MEVLAKVRHNLQVLPNRILKTVNQGGKFPVTISYVILNFTDANWEDVSVRSEAEWLVVEKPRPSIVRSDARVRQEWNAQLHFAWNDPLLPGTYRTSLKVADLPNRMYEEMVPVHITVEPTVVIVPTQLVFGDSQATVERRLVVSGMAMSHGNAPTPPLFARVDPVSASDCLRLSRWRELGGLWQIDIRRTDVLPSGNDAPVSLEVGRTESGEILGRIPVTLF